MAEAQPSKKRGGHAYGRRNLQISNTAEEGTLCLFSGHSLGRFHLTPCAMTVIRHVSDVLHQHVKGDFL